jgi:CRP/FNR family transcriptional regulator, cyclic AMP receptor protein
MRQMSLTPEAVVERVEMLRKIPVFASADEEDVKHVATVATEKRFSTGEILIREGAVGSDVFLMISGRCEVRRQVGKREKVLATLEPGQFFGEMAVLSPDPRTATVAAVADVRVLLLSAWEFQLALQDNAALASHIAKVLAQRLRDAEEELAQLRQRLANG